MDRILKLASFIILYSILPLSISGKQIQEVRAIWVTRWDYASIEDIRKIINNVADYHFNTVIFQVRGNATVYYPSKFEPWAEALGSADPGWNPLQEAIKQAKRRNLQLHAWMNVYPAWRGVEKPIHPDQVYNVYPEWQMVDANQKTMELNSHYVWNNPSIYGVQKHLENIVLELADTPGLDGIHFDYFRYPGPGFSYDDRTLKSFFDLHKIKPSEATKIWNQYRRDGITNWLRNVYQKVKAKRPGFQFSSAVIGDYDLGPKVFFQDSHQWLTEGIIDFIFPMTYTNDVDMLRRWLLRHGIHQRKERIYPGLMAYPDLDLLKNEIQLVRNFGFDGFSVFAYRSLFPNHQAIEEIETLQSILVSPVVLPALKDETSGKVISEVRWFPQNPTEDDSIRIVCKIDGLQKQSEYQAFLIWKAVSSDFISPRKNLVRMKSKPEYWYSSAKIPPQHAGETILLRAFVSEPNENIKQAIASDRYSMIISKKESKYKYDGEFGPLVTLVTRGVMDLNNRAWLLEPGNGIRVIEENGLEASFSPLGSFIDSNGDPQSFKTAAGIALLPENTIAISVMKDSIPILIANSQVQSSLLTKFELPILGVDLAASNKGSLFILSLDGWIVLNPEGDKIGHVSFPSIHTVNNIAVSEDGGDVFVACRTEGAVHHWVGSVSENYASYKQVQDLDVFNMSLGAAIMGRDGMLYLAETASGIIRILDQNLDLADILAGDRPGLSAPRLALPSSDNLSLLIFEAGGTTPIRMQRWVEN